MTEDLNTTHTHTHSLKIFPWLHFLYENASEYFEVAFHLLPETTLEDI